MPVTPWRRLQSNPFFQSPGSVSNHAFLQGIVNLISLPGSKAPPLSCVPVELASQTILYYDTGGNVALREFPDMVVKRCGCRWLKNWFDGFLRHCRPRASFSSCCSHEHQPKMQFPVFSEERMPVCFLWFRFWKKWPIFSITSFIASFNFPIYVFLLTRFASNLSFTVKESRGMEECYCPWNYRNWKKLHFGKWRRGKCFPLCSFPKTEHCPPSVPQC